MISCATKPAADTVNCSPGTTVEGVVVTVRVPMAALAVHGTAHAATRSAATRMCPFHVPLISLTCMAVHSPHPIGQRGRRARQPLSRVLPLGDGLVQQIGSLGYQIIKQ